MLFSMNLSSDKSFVILANMIIKKNDPIGQAIHHFHYNNDDTPLIVNSNITEGEVFPVSHFFRTYDKMPLLEKKAMSMVKGKVLDVGAGAGSHSFYLQKNGFDVTAIDISELSCEVMRNKGLLKVICTDIWTFESKPFDTLLFMMNGIGVVKNLDGLNLFFHYIKKFVTPNGQLILDSTDIKYMFEDHQEFLSKKSRKDYYGVLEYNISYKQFKGNSFCWLFVDFNRLKASANSAGWNVDLIYKSSNNHYLAKLVLNKYY